MSTFEEMKWERMRQLLGAAAVGADPKPVCSQRTLFGIKSSVEEQLERIVAQEEARQRFLARAHKALIFDLDGTLLDTLPDLVAITNEALGDFGWPAHTSQEIKSYVGGGLRELLRRATSFEASESQIDALFERWQEISAVCATGRTAPYPGMLHTLESLRDAGCKLAVLSNKVDAATQQVIGHFFPGMFDAVHGECPEFPRKPNPAGLLKTIAELDLIPADAAYVGDSPGDVAVAHAAGTLAVGVTWGYRPAQELRDEHPHVLCDRAEELLQLIAV